MLSWSFMNRDELSRHRSIQINQEPYIVWYVLSGNTQRHFFHWPKLWIGLRCFTVTQVAGKRNESICRRISGHWDHQDPDPAGINQYQIHCIIQLSRGVGVVSVTQCEDYIKCGLGTCSLRKLKNLMLMDQLPATLLWMILSLRLSAFLPVFENLLCFLFAVLGQQWEEPNSTWSPKMSRCQECHERDELDMWWAQKIPNKEKSCGSAGRAESSADCLKQCR